MPGPLGLGLPNRQWEAWGPNELDLAAELAPSACVVLVYGEQPPEAREAQVAASQELAARTGTRLLLRAYEPDVPRWAPTDWAGECARRARFFSPPARGDRGQGIGDREETPSSLSPIPQPLSPIEMIPGNEFNLACEGGSLVWAMEEGPRWLLHFARRYRRLRRGERLHLPAPSPGEGGAEAAAFWGACARAKVGRRYDVVDVHAYSDDQVRTLPRLAHEIFGLPVDLTEWNQADPELVAAEVRANPWLGSACYSILAGAEDQRHYWLVEQPDMLTAFRAVQSRLSAIGCTAVQRGPSIPAGLSGDRPLTADSRQPMATYHITLDGKGYLVNLDKYQRRPAAVFAAKRSEGARDVGDFLVEEGMRVSDWSGGEGFLQQDADHPERWRSGTGFDVYTEPGSLRSGPTWGLVTGSNYGAAEHTVAAVYKGNLYVGNGAGDVYVYNGSTWTLSRSTGKSGGIRALAVFNGLLYASNGTDGVVDEFNGTAWTAAKFTVAGSSGIRAMATFYRQAAQYLYLVSHRTTLAGIYWWDGATLSGIQYAPEEIGDRAAAIVLRNRLYFFVADTVSKHCGIYSVDDSGSGGVYRAHRAIDGNWVEYAAVHEGLAYLGSGRRGVIWSWDGTDLIELKRLGTQAAPHAYNVGGLVSWEGALWVGYQDAASTVGVLRFDSMAQLASGTAADDLGRARVGWTRPVAGLGSTTEPRAMVVFNDQCYLLTKLTSFAGVFASASTYAAGGTLETGLFDAALPAIDKVFRSVTITHAPLPASMSLGVQYRLDDSGSWTTLGTSSTTNATSATFTFSGTVTGKQIAFRLVVTGVAGSSSTPILYDFLLRYKLAPSVKREWEFPIVLEGTVELPQVTLDGTPNPRTAATMTGDLWTAKGLAGPVTFVDIDGVSRSVYFEDLREEVAELSQRKGYQTVAKVRLVEA